jgi:hypothetical protein
MECILSIENFNVLREIILDLILNLSVASFFVDCCVVHMQEVTALMKD